MQSFLLTFTIFLMPLTGGETLQEQAWTHLSQWQKLQEGMTIQNVTETLGHPLKKAEALGYMYWFYQMAPAVEITDPKEVPDYGWVRFKSVEENGVKKLVTESWSLPDWQKLKSEIQSQQQTQFEITESLPKERTQPAELKEPDQSKIEDITEQNTSDTEHSKIKNQPDESIETTEQTTPEQPLPLEEPAVTAKELATAEKTEKAFPTTYFIAALAVVIVVIFLFSALRPRRKTK